MKIAVAPSFPAPLGQPRHPLAPVLPVVGLGLALALGFARETAAQENPVTAIDIALEPDPTISFPTTEAAVAATL